MVFNPAFFARTALSKVYSCQMAGSLYVHAMDFEPDASALFMAVSGVISIVWESTSEAWEIFQF
jgi:hypothetical protein